MARIPIAMALISFLFASWPVHADVSGSLTVTDGDTLKMNNGVSIRLNGIDAPESGQNCYENSKAWRCGQSATRALKDRIKGSAISCKEVDRDRYGRIVADCWVGNTNLNAWLVSEGWALAYRRYSMAYVDEEALAKASGKGIWRGEFVKPWDWRRGKRLQQSATAGNGSKAGSGGNQGSGDCNIKGNISRNGAKIYHVPGGRYYSQTQINTSKGERWFCSESEAKSAGWRRSRQ